MFLVDKYNYISFELTTNQSLIKNILNSFNSHNFIYNNLEEVKKKQIMSLS